MVIYQSGLFPKKGGKNTGIKIPEGSKFEGGNFPVRVQNTGVFKDCSKNNGFKFN